MHAAALRLSVFVGLWMALALAEWRFPRHGAPPRRDFRWPVNLGLAVVDTVCLRLLLPWLAIDAAHWGQARAFGLFNLLVWPGWLAAIVGFLALDLTIYFQHRLMHAVPLLWRMHKVHHSDLALDVSSGTRFHPLEIMLSMLIKIGVVLLIGIAAPVVLAFEIVLSAFSLMTHANLAIPERWERRLRRVLVTPDMHRIHHSVHRTEHDSNFCFHLSWWDRLFGTYLASSQNREASMSLGLVQHPHAYGLYALLALPFRRRENGEQA
jgi:sterol desaturase/sphingolipid hydroxylase (fatty acid hydroxylase superfamily)